MRCAVVLLLLVVLIEAVCGSGGVFQPVLVKVWKQGQSAGGGERISGGDANTKAPVFLDDARAADNIEPKTTKYIQKKPDREPGAVFLPVGGPENRTFNAFWDIDVITPSTSTTTQRPTKPRPTTQPPTTTVDIFKLYHSLKDQIRLMPTTTLRTTPRRTSPTTTTPRSILQDKEFIKWLSEQLKHACASGILNSLSAGPKYRSEANMDPKNTPSTLRPTEPLPQQLLRLDLDNTLPISSYFGYQPMLKMHPPNQQYLYGNPILDWQPMPQQPKPATFENRNNKPNPNHKNKKKDKEENKNPEETKKKKKKKKNKNKKKKKKKPEPKFINDDSNDTEPDENKNNRMNAKNKKQNNRVNEKIKNKKKSGQKNKKKTVPKNKEKSVPKNKKKTVSKNNKKTGPKKNKKTREEPAAYDYHFFRKFRDSKISSEESYEVIEYEEVGDSSEMLSEESQDSDTTADISKNTFTTTTNSSNEEKQKTKKKRNKYNRGDPIKRLHHKN